MPRHFLTNKLLVSFLIITALLIVLFFSLNSRNQGNSSLKTLSTKQQSSGAAQSQQFASPLQIAAMRSRSYEGSRITIEQTLPDGSNYHQYLASYLSDGLKIYALLTVPFGQKPTAGWPVIVFNHGYIDPRQYETFPQVGQYATYYPVFSSNGYIVFKPDYRGNGNSDGQPEGAYYSPAYTIDDLNAIASIKKLQDPVTGSSLIVNPDKIGVWGHSMGGNITLRDLVIDSSGIKAAVIWGGVVGSYEDLSHWHDPNFHPSAYNLALRNKYRSQLVKKYGSPWQNPAFWNSIDPTYFVKDITTPVQLHAGEADEEVPPDFSLKLYDQLKAAGKTVEYYTYPGANHNITQGFDEAMQRSLGFFNKYLK